MTKLPIAFASAAMLAAGVYYYWLRQEAQAEAKDKNKPVAALPQRRKPAVTVNATGSIRLRTGAEVRVGSQISGIVTELNVGAGSHVRAGDLIAVIESRGLQARIADAKAQIAVDESATHKVERDRARAGELLKDGLIPRQQVEDLDEDLRNSQAKVLKSRSGLEVIESDLPYLEIRAPIAGTVASVSTLRGETVAASFAAPTFVTIIADHALELVAMVDETDIGGVRPKQPVVFETETFPLREFHGSVERIAPKATIVSGVVNYEVSVAIRDGMQWLKPDMTANVTIQTSREERSK